MFNRTDCEGFHRRDFIRLGATGLLGLTLPDALRLEAAASHSGGKRNAKSVIMVWLAGGPATIDMWDLKPGAPDGIRGEFKPIPTNVSGIEISEHLPKMAQVADKISIVRSIAHTIPSHEIATTFMTTGNKPTAALQYPSLGSLSAKLLPVERGLPPFVAMGDVRGGRATQAGYLGSGYNAFLVEGNAGRPGKGKAGPGNLTVRGISLPNNFSLESLDKRDKLLQSFDEGFKALDKSGDLVEGLDTFHQQALEILRSDKTKKAFNLAAESDSTRERYGVTPFGQGMLAARRMIEAGVRFVSVGLGGWDTHESNFARLKDRLLPPLDQSLSALVEDLDQRGLLDSTIVYCAGEFGRTPKINNRGSGGRDHWARSMAVVLAGGGIRRGYVHGATDSSGMAPIVDACTPDDLASTVFQQLGIDHTLELATSNGRMVQLFREGRVVDKLLA